jgi:hypothetical protein
LACPFRDAGPLIAYFKNCDEYAVDFGQQYNVDDGQQETLARMRRQLEIYKAARESTNGLEGAEWEIVGREKLVFTIVNPYGPVDERRDEFDTKGASAGSLSGNFVVDLSLSQSRIVWLRTRSVRPLDRRLGRRKSGTLASLTSTRRRLGLSPAAKSTASVRFLCFFVFVVRTI